MLAAKPPASDVGSTGVESAAQPPDPATLHEVLEKLEQAIRDHAEWHENLLRAVVCGSSFDLNDLTASAHFQCRFGRWYYEHAAAEVRRQPSYAAISREHEHQHRIAARLLRDVVADAPIVREDFEELVAAGKRLRLQLDALRQEVQGGLQARDALTGAFGRAEMLPEPRGWRELAMRGVQNCCIVFMDLDHFKEVNDPRDRIVRADAARPGRQRPGIHRAGRPGPAAGEDCRSQPCDQLGRVGDDGHAPAAAEARGFSGRLIRVSGCTE